MNRLEGSSDRDFTKLLPEYPQLPRVTQLIIDELGLSEFLTVIFTPKRYATAGDSIWGLASDCILTNNGTHPKSGLDERQYQQWKDKTFQKIIAEKMELKLIFEKRNKPIEDRSLSEALESILGAIWYKRGGMSAPLPVDLFTMMLDLLSDEERSMRRHKSAKDEILYYYPKGKIQVTHIAGTKRYVAQLFIDGKVLESSGEIRGEAKATAILARKIRENK